MRRIGALVLVLLLAACAPTALAAENEATQSYPAMTVTINDAGEYVAAPDKTATLSVSGGSGSFTYQWYSAKAINADGSVPSPAKGVKLGGQTAASFSAPTGAKEAGRYLYAA